MAKTNIKNGIVDFDYIKALNIIDPNYLNKIFITLRGGNIDHVNSDTDWYKINNTNLLVNLYLDHNKKKLYALSISKMSDKMMESLTDLESLSIAGGSNSTNVKKRTYRRKTVGRPKSPAPSRGKSPSKNKTTGLPGRPKKMYSSPERLKNDSEEQMYKIDYKDVDEYGGRKKKRGRKPNKTLHENN